MVMIYAECSWDGDPLEGVTVWCHPKFSLTAYSTKTDSSGRAQLSVPYPFFVSENVYAERSDLETQTFVMYGDIGYANFVWDKPEVAGEVAGRGEPFTLAGLLKDLGLEWDWKTAIFILACIVGLGILVWGLSRFKY